MEFFCGFLSQKELDPDFVDFNSVNRRYHFPARSYIPLRANFIQIDPQATGNPGRNQGLYLYAMANPLMRIDPTGRFSALSYGQGGLKYIAPGFGVGLSWVDPSIHGWGLVNVFTRMLSSSMFGGLVLGAMPTQQPPFNRPPGPTPGDKLTEAIATAKRLLDKAAHDTNDIAYNDAPDAAVVARYNLWFGDPLDHDRAVLVYSRFYAALATINTPTYRGSLVMHKFPDNNEPLSYADSTGTSPTFITNLYPPGLTQSASTPPSSIAGILIHELIHVLPGNLGVAWDAGEMGLRRMGTPKQHKETADVTNWRIWAKTWGPPAGPGGDGWPITDKVRSKTNDPNCYKYFAEGQ